MGFGNLGIWEILIIAVIVLVFFGPRRLPEIARSSGKAIREFKRGLNEIQRELELSEQEDPVSPPAAKSPAPGLSPETASAVAPDSGPMEPVEARRPFSPPGEKATVPDPAAGGEAAGGETAAPDPAQEELFG